MQLEEFEKEHEKFVKGNREIRQKIRVNLDRQGEFLYLVGCTGAILDDLDVQFQKRTELNPTDISIMFVAIGLQVLRQYLVTNFPKRLDDQEAANEVHGDEEEHSNRHHRYYNPSLEEIITNPVPFDANIGANGALTGGGKLGHRGKTLGHDPIVGLVFGTANIATSTLTTTSGKFNIESYHIVTQNKRDVFSKHARTDLVLTKTGDKLFKEGLEGKRKVGCALCKEIIHLRSDINTKNSLPLPIITSIDPLLASKLAEYGVDMCNLITIVKQYTYSSLINTIIAMFHGMFFQGGSSMDQKMYEAKTRKVLTYSNIVASSTNLMAVGIAQANGVENALKYLDVGGLINTIYRVITDYNFINKVKEEFVFGKYKDMVDKI